MQYETLVSFMEENPSLAKGYLRTADSRTKATQLWDKMTPMLNQDGPPVRTIKEWKKVHI